MIKVGTIREIHRQLVAEGYDISEYRLRIWTKQGVLPSIHLGTKSLISYRKVLELLEEALEAVPG